MTYLIGTAVFIGAGYSLVLLLDISRRHLLYDIALGWFVGAAYYSSFMALLVYLAGVPVSKTVSILIMALPMLLVLLRSKRYLSYISGSFINARNTKYIPTGWTNIVPIILIIYSVLVFVLIVIHSTSTPSSGDDSLDLRAYTPSLVYSNDFTDNANRLILQNGVWPSFVTVLFFHLHNMPDHFYVNYTILTSLFFFLTLLYIAPSMRGANNQGIYGVFLVLSLPLFIYHSTITYADIRLAMPYALGFLFFAFFVKELEYKDLKTSVLFFFITCLIKSKGIIAGLTGLTFSIAFLTAYFAFKKIDISPARIGKLYLPPFIVVAAYLSMQVQYDVGLLTLFVDLKDRISSTTPAYQVVDLTGPNQKIHTKTNGREEESSPPLYLADAATEHGETTPVFNGKKEMSDSVVQSTLYSRLLKTTYFVKLSGFFRSMFSSGNFGILFYILTASVILNFRKIVSTRLIWEFGFLVLVFLETLVFMVVITDVDHFIMIVHRSVLVLSVISAVYLAPLLARQGLRNINGNSESRISGQGRDDKRREKLPRTSRRSKAYARFG